jgi:major vault protein
MVLAPNEYAFISDGTDGKVGVIVGPKKEGMTDTDQPVYFDQRKKRFIPCNLHEAKQIWATAPEGWYLVLKNPHEDLRAPDAMKKVTDYKLEIGRKVNIQGPVSFPLWPGQMVATRQGHHLRSNQYLLCRVYDEEAAQKSWAETVMKPQTEGEEDPKPVVRPDLSMGKLFNVVGTQTSFFIPGSGVEVVSDDQGHFVRNAVTLERLEYSVLVDESGEKAYAKGPDVVFPAPTQRFLKMGDKKSRKFRAIELNHLQGLYLKVIKPYSEGGKTYAEGDELFVKGGEEGQNIYWPREEHAIIRYANRRKHFAVAIPPGEGRYVLDRNNGKVNIQPGPQMLLPDPRVEVIVRRVLSRSLVELLYPGNAEAIAYNESLGDIAGSDSHFVTERAYEDGSRGPQKRHLMGKGRHEKGGGGHSVLYAAMSNADAETAPWSSERAVDGPGGDAIDRSSQYTRPHSVALDTKYDGVVSFDVWSGYAALLVSKSGTRRVVEGPQTILMEYDEEPERLSFSGGVPKGCEEPTRTVFLRVQHNKVADRITVETADFCRVSIDLCLRVNFEGENKENWFAVEDYTRFLTDHVRSMLRNVTREQSIEDFYADSISIIRDAILGVQGEDGNRPGMVFSENGMRVYDVDVLEVTIEDRNIAQMLRQDKTAVVTQGLTIASARRALELTQEQERVKQLSDDVQHESAMKAKGRQESLEEAERQLGQARLDGQKDAEIRQGQIVEARLVHQAQDHEFGLRRESEHQQLAVELLEKEAMTYVQRAAAVSPKLVAALEQLGDKISLRDIMASSGVPAYVMGDTVPAFVQRLLKGTRFEDVMLPKGNGSSGKGLPVGTRD